MCTVCLASCTDNNKKFFVWFFLHSDGFLIFGFRKLHDDNDESTNLLIKKFLKNFLISSATTFVFFSFLYRTLLQYCLI